MSDVYGLPEPCPVLIGQIPLESMDIVVDPKNRQLIGNSDRDGERVIEAY